MAIIISNFKINIELNVFFLYEQNFIKFSSLL